MGTLQITARLRWDDVGVVKVVLPLCSRLAECVIHTYVFEILDDHSPKP